MLRSLLAALALTFAFSATAHAQYFFSGGFDSSGRYGIRPTYIPQPNYYYAYPAYYYPAYRPGVYWESSVGASYYDDQLAVQRELRAIRSELARQRRRR